MAISGGLEKGLKVNKRGGCNKRGGGGKSSKVDIYGVGCYKWMWRREDQHMHWIKIFNFLKNIYYVYYIFLAC